MNDLSVGRLARQLCACTNKSQATHNLATCWTIPAWVGNHHTNTLNCEPSYTVACMFEGILKAAGDHES